MLKKILIGLTILTILNSCKKDSTTSQNQTIGTDQEILQLVKGLGQKHNDAMANAKIKLDSFATAARLNSLNPTIPADTLVETFIQSNANDSYGYYGHPDSIYFGLEETYEFLRENIYGDYLNEAENTNYPHPLDGIQLSTEFINAKDEIKATILTATSSEQIRTELESESEDLIATVDDDTEKLAIAGMIEIAISSSEYWSVHLDEWNETLGSFSSTIQSRRPTDWKEVAWADAVGAGVGAVRGAIKGTVFGAAYGAACGGLWGMFTGAVGGSAGDYLTQRVKSWINW